MGYWVPVYTRRLSGSADLLMNLRIKFLVVMFYDVVKYSRGKNSNVLTFSRHWCDKLETGYKKDFLCEPFIDFGSRARGWEATPKVYGLVY